MPVALPYDVRLRLLRVTDARTDEQFGINMVGFYSTFQPFQHFFFGEVLVLAKYVLRKHSCHTVRYRKQFTKVYPLTTRSVQLV